MRHKFLLYLLAVGLFVSACLSGDVSPHTAHLPWIRQVVPVDCDCPPEAWPDRLGIPDAIVPYPQTTDALYAMEFLWTANTSGLLTQWDTDTGDYHQYHLPDGSVVSSLAAGDRQIYAGSNRGSLWVLPPSSATPIQISQGRGRITAIAQDGSGNVWYASASQLTEDGHRDLGQGLVRVATEGDSITFTYLSEDRAEIDPSRRITDMVFDPQTSCLWAATSCCGILRFQPGENVWDQYAPDHHSPASITGVSDLNLGCDGVLRAASGEGLLKYWEGEWLHEPLPETPQESQIRKFHTDGSGNLWGVGDEYIGLWDNHSGVQIFRTENNTLLADRTRCITITPDDQIWFVGQRGRVYYDGAEWTAYDVDARRFSTFVPVAPREVASSPINFPSPREDYSGWLRAWPRPEDDNGLGLHFLQSQQFDEIEAQRQVNRLHQLGIHWTVVIYRDADHLQMIAPIFQAAGINVIWRPFVRPYQIYAGWERDVFYLQSRGMAPYMQLYNEPSLNQEWAGWGTIDRELFLSHMLNAAGRVYDSGGYVGLQFVNPEWLSTALRHIQDTGNSRYLERSFFIPHLYGLNHPPGYADDINGVLGFREYADLFRREIGFVPPMLVGEGGWRPGEAQDNRYQAINEQLHRDYHLAVFDWFRTGKLSNGDPLPDYVFTFCPWLLADPNDPAAWFDSASGDRTLTIQAVEHLPPFVRRSSWDIKP